MVVRRRVRWAVWLVLAAAGLAGVSGCYEKVIRASGPGAWQYKVEESNRDNNIFADFKDEKK